MDDVKLLQKINWNGLSCFERALCFGAMSFNKNSLYAFLLLKMRYRNYFSDLGKYSIASDDYYLKLFSILGLGFERKTCDRDKFLYELQKEMEKGAYVIICTNTYDIEGTKDYKNKNHPHFIPISEFNDDKIIIIDEDWTKNYWYKENAKDEVIYLPKSVSFNDLIRYASRYYICSDDCRENNCCYITVYKKELKQADLSIVLQEYLQSLEIVLENKSLYFEQIVPCVKSFYKSFEKYITALGDAGRVEVNELQSSQSNFVLKNRYIYPGDLELIACHHFYLDSQYQALKLMFSSIFIESQLYKNFDLLLSKYNCIKLFIAKDIYVKKADHEELNIKLAGVCLDLEIKLYRDIMQFINKNYNSIGVS